MLGQLAESRTRTRRVMIILIFIPGHDAEDPLPDNAECRLKRISARVGNQARELLRPAQFLIQPAEQTQASIRCEILFQSFQFHSFSMPLSTFKMIHSLNTHPWPRCVVVSCP